jgi:hypothetical protein
MTRNARPIVLLLALVAGVSAGCAEKQTSLDLVDELGCAACHLGPPATTAMTKRAPNLQDAGNRFRPAYLFEFLQQPDTVRRGIGSARMPDYRFSARVDRRRR